jgi:hypothetical protein
VTKELILQEVIVIMNVYASNIRALNYIKKILTDNEEKIGSNNSRGLQYPLSTMYVSLRH